MTATEILLALVFLALARISGQLGRIARAAEKPNASGWLRK